MVFSRSNSSGAPSRANFLSRRRATLMFLVPSSTESSRLRYSRWSQTFTALRLRERSWPMRTPSGVVAVGAERRGAGGADPLRAALVAAFLLLEALLQRLHELLPAAERFDLLLLLFAQR